MSTPSIAALPDLAQLYVTAVHDIWLTRVAAFVGATIVVYDYIVTIDREVELIWKRKWSTVKAVFIWHRYFGLFCVVFQAIALNLWSLNDRFCSFWFRWETWGYCVLLFSSEIVLTLWIWVVYHKHRGILALLLTCFCAEVGGVVGILVKTLSKFSTESHLIPNLPFCVITSASPDLRYLWVPIIGYDSIILALFLFKAVKAWWTGSWSQQFGVLQMIYKHSLMNFLAIFAAYLTSAIMWTHANPALAQIPVCFAISFSIVNCTRLLINIRRAFFMHPDAIDYPGFYPPVMFASHTSPRAASPTPLWEQDDASTMEGGKNIHVVYTGDGHMSEDEVTRQRWQYELRQLKADSRT